jgi:hypothetical protein
VLLSPPIRSAEARPAVENDDEILGSQAAFTVTGENRFGAEVSAVGRLYVQRVALE